MKGTTVLFQENQQLTIIENVDKSVYESLKKECLHKKRCKCKLNKVKDNFGPAAPIFWCDENVDWDYGY